MPNRSRKHEDANQIAYRTIGQITGEIERPKEKDPAAVSLGRRGGLKGGKARAAKLSKERLSEIGRKAVETRWRKHKEQDH
ncbi:MAG TPA: hypothetical protein VMF50_08595 [Candidatus Binataceae bacterium]|nr:hypothetical protein [Candidatus Binataceae bacterium]